MSNINIHKLTLDINLNEVKAVKIKQYDTNSQQLLITVTDKGLKYPITKTDVTVTFKMLTPDNRAILNPATINDDGTITVELTESCTVVGGFAKAEILIISTVKNSVLITATFNIVIEKSVYDSDKVVAEPEFDELTRIITEHNDIKSDMEDIIQRGEDFINDPTVLKSPLLGANDGIAQLDDAGRVPSNQLPSFVDDVLNGTLIDDHTFHNESGFSYIPESGKIYIDVLTNRSYRWSGSAYSEISKSLALGETSATAYAGDKGKKLADDLNALGSDLSSYKTNNSTELSKKLDKSGGTMTGDLVLKGAPTQNLHAATKQYVDEATEGIDKVGVSKTWDEFNVMLTNGTVDPDTMYFVKDINNGMSGKPVQMTKTEYNNYISVKGTDQLNTLFYISDWNTGITNAELSDSISNIGSSAGLSGVETVIGTYGDTKKPLYRKTINTGALPSNYSKLVAHGISNMDIISRLDGFCRTSTTDAGATLPMPYVSAASYADSTQLPRTIALAIVGSDIQLITNFAAASTTYIDSRVVVEYTKTTDSPVVKTQTQCGAFIFNGKVYQGTSNSASNIGYDNSTSGLVAATVKAAIDEMNEKFKSDIASLTSNLVNGIEYSSTITLENGVTITNASYLNSYKKNGNELKIKSVLNCTIPNSTSYTKVATLPVSARPSTSQMCCGIVFVNNMRFPCNIRFDTDGTVNVCNYTSAAASASILIMDCSIQLS